MRNVFALFSILKLATLRITTQPQLAKQLNYDLVILSLKFFFNTELYNQLKKKSNPFLYLTIRKKVKISERGNKGEPQKFYFDVGIT